MVKLDDRTRARLDVVLEETCRTLPHGGDHALRKAIAKRLLQSAQEGNTAPNSLSGVARTALIEATKPQKSA
ncbi:hypothetical protein [Bradyrhizobium sp.]|uniref:hypothetical protein n=1 Tax=Bradyrhizobium sp. TaxID=376 RepID=UPI003C48D60D